MTNLCSLAGVHGHAALAALANYLVVKLISRSAAPVVDQNGWYSHCQFSVPTCQVKAQRWTESRVVHWITSMCIKRQWKRCFLPARVRGSGEEAWRLICRVVKARVATGQTGSPEEEVGVQLLPSGQEGKFWTPSHQGSQAR